MPVVSLTKPNRFTFTGFLSYTPSVVVFSRAIYTTTYSPADTCKLLAYDDPYSGVGSDADVKVGMTVIIRVGNTDAIKGVLYVAPGGADTGVLQVNEFSRGDLIIEDNDRIDVIAEFDPREALVANNDTFDKYSRIAAGSYPSDPPPMVNSGGPVVDTINATTGVITANHYGSTSWSPDPDGGTITHAWDFIDATPPTSSDEDPTGIEYPEGFRFVEHVGTHTNGTSETEFVAVWAHGPNYPPMSVRLDTRSASIDQGYHTVTFSVPRSMAAQVQAMSDRALIAYSENELRDGTPGSFGTNVAGRESIKFVGHLISRSISISADGDTLSFTAIGSVGIAATLGALSQVMKSGTTSKWTYVKTLTVWRALTYLLYWGSTLKLLHDFIMADGDPYLYAALTIDNVTSIKGQMDDLSKSIAVRFCSDQLSRMLLWRELPYLSVSDRAARTKIIDFTVGFVVTVEWDEDFRPATKLVLIDAIGTGSTTASQQAFFGWAPGNAPGEGTETSSLDKQITLSDDDFAEAKQRVGDEYARLNGKYWNESDNTIRRVPMGVRLRVIGAADVVDPCLGEPVGFILPATTNTLGISFGADELWIVRELSVTYDSDAGTKQTDLVVDHETRGPAGTARPRPDPLTTGVDTGLTDFGNYNPGNTTVPVGYNPNPTFVGAPIKLFATSPTGSGTVKRASSWVPATGVCAWEDISDAAMGTIYHACADPYAYASRAIASSAGVFMADVWATVPTWVLLADNTTVTGNASWSPGLIRMSPNRRGFMCCVSGANVYCWSDDYGITWHQVSIDGAALSGGNGRGSTYATLMLSARNTIGSGVMFAGVGKKIYKSTDWGVTWSLSLTNANSDGSSPVINVPYMRTDAIPNINDASQVVYAFFTFGDNGTFWTSINGGTSWSIGAISGAFHARYPSGSTHADATNIYTQDGRILAWIGNGYEKGLHRTLTGTSPFSWPAGFETDFTSFYGVNGWPNDPTLYLYFDSAHGIRYLNLTDGSNRDLNTGLGVTSVNYADWDLSDYI